jgi:hypothetical protein
MKFLGTIGDLKSLEAAFLKAGFQNTSLLRHLEKKGFAGSMYVGNTAGCTLYPEHTLVQEKHASFIQQTLLNAGTMLCGRDMVANKSEIIVAVRRL